MLRVQHNLRVCFGHSISPYGFIILYKKDLVKYEIRKNPYFFTVWIVAILQKSLTTVPEETFDLFPVGCHASLEEAGLAAAPAV